MGRASLRSALIALAVIALIGLRDARAGEHPVVGFVPGEGFRLLSPDGNWRLRIGLQVAAAYQPTFVNDQANWASYRIPYARLYASGHLWKKWIRYSFNAEFATFPAFLLDGFVEVQPRSWLGVRIGQMFTPISTHEAHGPDELVFVDWAVVANYFWTGRDKGLEVFGESRIIDYHVGLYADAPPSVAVSTPGHFQLIGRATIHPLGPLGSTEMPFVTSEEPVPFRCSFSFQGYWGKVTPTTVGFNPSNGFFTRTEQSERKHAAASADVELQWRRFGFHAEYYARYVEPLDGETARFWQQGFWAQTHVTVYRRVLDVSLRFNWLDPSNQLRNDRFLSGEAQLGWWPVGGCVSLRLRYAIAHQQDPGPAPATNPMLYSAVAVPVLRGLGHVITLQASVFF
jgi:hypothetical protein